MLPVSNVSRLVNAERVVLLGWTRAILLQLAHPLVAAGVSEHSTFRGGTRAAFSRLRHTVDSMLAITFGDAAEQERALEGIRVIHRRVHGTLSVASGRFAAGTPYSAEDPRLLLWVHATLIESILLAYDQLVAPLGEALRDEYCRDSAEVAIALGAHPAEVPRSWRALQAYLDGEYRAGSIAVSAEARGLARALLSPVSTPVAAPLNAVLALLTAGLLPAAVRQAYELAWNARRERAFRIVVRLLRAARRASPAAIRSWPQARAHPETLLPIAR